MNKFLTSAAVLGVMAASTGAFAEEAAKPAAAPAPAKVKCLGIAETGKNDCASANGSHSCAGQAKTDKDANEWKFADSKEACESAGGKVAEAAPAAAAPSAGTPAAAPAAAAPAEKAEEKKQ